MPNEESKIHLTDLIDIKFLQELQDTFAKTIGIASLTIDDQGPITKPSNFAEFCSNFIRQNSLGGQRCNECDIEGGRLALEKGEPVIYTCHAGLTHLVVPIIVAGQHIASIIGGQFSKEPPNEEHFRKVAKELGIEDEKKYIEALRKVKIIPEENIKSAAQLLFIVANSISEIARKNYELSEKSKKESLIRNITEKMRSSLDIEEILSFICEETAKLFKVQRVTITVFPNQNNYENYIIRKEYTTLSNIKIYVQSEDASKTAAYFGEKLTKNQNILAFDNIEESDVPIYFKNTYKEIGVKANIGASIKKGKDVWGILVLSECRNNRHWTDEEKNLLSTIANQVYIAINQAELYVKEKKTAERETILRDITNKMRSSLDIDEVKHEIVFQIGALLKADRVAFADYEESKGNYFIAENNEYRSSLNVKTFVGYDFAGTPGFIESIRERHISGKDIIFSDLDKYLEENNIKDTGVEAFYREFGFMSSMAINMEHGDEFYGNLVITYEEKHEITNEDVEFIRMLANQAGIALYQAELYEKEKQTAKRETILRDITNNIRSSLDIKLIQREIVNQIGDYFNAAGVRIADYDYKLGDYIVSKEAEYMASEDMKSMVGLNFKNIPGFTEYIRDVHFSGQDIIFSDLEKYLDEKKLRETGVEKFYRDYGFISSAAINIYYNDTYLGDFVITFNEKRDFSEDEINFLKTLANQSGTAFYQARLYTKEKETTEKEITLRETIKVLRSTLDPEEIKNRFVEITCNYFNADRCFFDDYDKKTNKFLPFRIEKLKSNEIKSFKGTSVEEFFPEFAAKLKRGRNVIIKDLKKTLSRRDLVGYKSLETLSKGDTKSDYGLFVKYNEQIMGILIIHFIEEKRALTHDELDFLKVLRDQVGMALFQAELYSMTRKKVEEDTLLRSITETIRSSLNIDETKKRIVNVIGKTLKADRCFILEYNKANDKFLIINEEYLSSDNILSYKGVDVNINVPNLVREFKKGRRLIVNASRFQFDDEKLDLNNGRFEEEKEAIEKYKVYSALAFPIFYNEEFLGDLVLHYVEGKHDVGDEEIDFLNLIASQVGIALQQAKLYEKIQLQAERERLSRNIIEILRSTMDKNTIKHLFVRNIGKYFNADRVYFSEFDHKENKYIPVDTQSEYLSSPEEKSFVCYDLSGEIMSSHIQPLMDKRELIIPCWCEYVKNNHKSPELLSLYEEFNVQSSYSFPVLYEGRIMGYFCIEFTHKICELLDEDINRIRSICTQAGIALYHAELYMQAQEALQSKDELIIKVKNGIKEPVDKIMETSKLLSEQKFEHEKQQEYLNNIINSCNQLMELTKDISDDI